MSRLHSHLAQVVALVVLGALVVALTVGVAWGRSVSEDVGANRLSLTDIQVLDVNCASLPSFTTSYAKISDIGTFNVQAAGSTVEITFNGRLFVGSFDPSASGALFELRVDDSPTTHGRARTLLRFNEVGGAGLHASITGIFGPLSTGNHTVSAWVASEYGGGSNAMINKGCWDADHLIIKKYAPLSTAFLPTINKSTP